MEKILIQFLLSDAEIVALPTGTNIQPLAQDQDVRPPFLIVQQLRGHHTVHQFGAEGSRETWFLLICHAVSADQADTILEQIGDIINCESGYVTVNNVKYQILGIFIEDEETEFDPPIHGDQIGDPNPHKLLYMWHQPA